MRQNYHTFYSEFKKEDLIRSDKIPELNNRNSRISADMYIFNLTITITKPFAKYSSVKPKPFCWKEKVLLLKIFSGRPAKNR